MYVCTGLTFYFTSCFSVLSWHLFILMFACVLLLAMYLSEMTNKDVQSINQWRNNEHDGVSNHRRLDWLLNCLFRRISKETSKLRVTGLCERNSPVTAEFHAQKASNAENVFISWRHHECLGYAYGAIVTYPVNYAQSFIGHCFVVTVLSFHCCFAWFTSP